MACTQPSHQGTYRGREEASPMPHLVQNNFAMLRPAFCTAAGIAQLENAHNHKRPWQSLCFRHIHRLCAALITMSLFRGAVLRVLLFKTI